MKFHFVTLPTTAHLPPFFLGGGGWFQKTQTDFSPQNEWPQGNGRGSERLSPHTLHFIVSFFISISKNEQS